MKRFAPIVILVLVAVAAALVYFNKSDTSQQVKSAHFVDSTPLHNEVYAAQPINVTINFNFDLAVGSQLSVEGAGQEWTSEAARIEDVQTALQANLKPGLPDGDYTVKYTACWPDKSCHDGRYSFKIDSAKRSEYVDHRGQKQVTIKMNNIAFGESKVIVSPGTEVTWVNDEAAGHYVNTETHPEHTYFTRQNSREILKAGSFKTIFERPGQYNYHCSAHYPQMVGSLLVLE